MKNLFTSYTIKAGSSVTNGHFSSNVTIHQIHGGRSIVVCVQLNGVSTILRDSEIYACSDNESVYLKFVLCLSGAQVAFVFTFNSIAKLAIARRRWLCSWVHGVTLGLVRSCPVSLPSSLKINKQFV